MDQLRLLIMEVTFDRLVSLHKRVVSGDWLSEEERIEFSQLFIDFCQFQTYSFEDSINLMEELTKLNIEINNSLYEEQVKLNISSFQYGLAEHFIINNGLEDQYIKLLKSVAESETDVNYKEAAKYHLDFYHVKDDVYEIEDEYFWIKEDMVD
jgi:hypothetical protein